MMSARCRLVAALLSVASLFAAFCGETNHNFAQWEKEVSAFERSDATNPPPHGAILFIGSSTIRLWTTLAQDFPDRRVINRGFGGSHIEDSTHFADRVILPYAPRAVFLRAGVNDLWAGKAPEKVFADFKAFVTAVHANLPETDIYFIAINPTPARWSQHEKEKALNTLVREFAGQKPHLKYIETYAMVLGPNGQPRAELFEVDKLHLNAAGYKLLAEAVRPHLPPEPPPAGTEAK